MYNRPLLDAMISYLLFVLDVQRMAVLGTSGTHLMCWSAHLKTMIMTHVLYSLWTKIWGHLPITLIHIF